MSKSDQHIFFNLLRAKDSKLLYIFLAYLISFILTAIVAKKDVIEDSALLPHIEEKMKTMPDFFGLQKGILNTKK